MTVYERIIEHGTLSNIDGKPDPKYALPSTVNWMRGLAIRIDNEKINHDSARTFYHLVNKKDMSIIEVNTIFEQLIFALHHCSALQALKNSPCKSDVARVGILGWYYGIYNAASAMVAAQDGSFQDNHNGTTIVWDKQISATKLIPPPFDLRITTLLEKDSDEELNNLLILPRFPLIHTPRNNDEAYGACHAYLSGNAKWWRWKTSEDIKLSKEFKNLGVNDFRKNVARELRDSRLKKKSVCFLHQAFRYRGKANYREALFLGYGLKTESTLTNYINDLSTVLDAFVCLAGIFCSRRLGKDIWKEFVDELEGNHSFMLSPHDIWGEV